MDNSIAHFAVHSEDYGHKNRGKVTLKKCCSGGTTSQAKYFFQKIERTYIMEELNYAEKFSKLTDDELHCELLRCTNDGYLLCSSEEQAAKHYHERRAAVWSELEKRKLVHKI